MKLWTPDQGPANAPSFNHLTNTPSLKLESHQVMKLWRSKPKYFFRDVMDVTLDPWQEDCVELYLSHQRLGLVASKGPGKTGLLAFLGWHFFITGHQPKMAALSISKDHLKSNLWAELLRWRASSKLLTISTIGGMEQIDLKGHEGYSFISARSYPKQADENTMSSVLAGLHANNVAFLIDEAGTIPDSVLATADAALSTGESNVKRARMLVTANPEEPRGMLYRAYMGRSKQKWAIYTISGDPEDPKRAPRVSIDWAKEQIDTYGRDDPWVMVNVLGKYPLQSSEKLISEEEIFESMKRVVEERDIKQSQPRMGVDVSRGGIDSSAIAIRRGLLAYDIQKISSNIRGPELAGKVAFLKEEHGVERIFVDDTGGYGSSVIDSLELYPRIDLTAIKYNAKAQDNRRYLNTRTEMWVRMRDWIRKGGKLPNDPGLAEELLMPKLFFNGGIFSLEAKEQIKARLGRSPDKADALAQTFKDLDQPSFFANQEIDYYHGRPRDYGNGGNYYSDESQLDNSYQSYSNYKS